MYIRVVVGQDDEDHRQLNGVIIEARLLRDEGRLVSHEIVWLEELFDWFNDNVTVPPYEVNKDIWPQDVAAWFKADAAKVVTDKIWDVVALLRENGKSVRILRSAAPGVVYYEDEVQVVVSEFRKI